MLDSLGNWKIIALETGDFRLDGGAMMGSVPKVLWEKTNPPDGFNRIDLALRCLLLDNGEYRILIESGANLTSSFLNNNLVDDFKLFISNKNLKKYGRGEVKDLLKLLLKNKKIIKEKVNLFGDKLLSYKMK